MATTRLTRTPSSAGNRKKFNFSFWIKGNDFVSDYIMFSASGSSESAIVFDSSSRLEYYEYNGSSKTTQITTNRVFRDCSAWYHINISIDTTQSTASNRVKFYVNGVQETSLANSTYGAEDFDSLFNNTTAQYIGGNASGGQFDGSMSYINFNDGYVYPASTFGSTDSTTGEWKINTSPSMTMGTNGFTILKDGNIITDQSSNSNDWSLAAGTLTKTEDCPDNNFATLNPLVAQGDTFTNGNTTYTRSGSGWRGSYSTIGLPSTGKFYCEFKISSGSNLADLRAGIADDKSGGCIDLQNRGQVNQIGVPTNSISYTASNGNADINNSTTSSYGAAISTSNVLGMAVDMTNMKLYYSKDGVFQNSGVPTSGSTGTGALSIPATTGTYFVGVGVNTSGWYVNFGNGAFGSTQLTGTTYQATGVGIFKYQPPTGYTALSTKGLNL